MIFEVQDYGLIFQDAVYSLAVGFLVGAVNQLLGCFLYKGKKKIFVKDVVAWLFFAVAIFSYSVSFANYKVLRWYNVVFALIGRLCFSANFSKVINGIIVIIIKKLKTGLEWAFTKLFGKIKKIKGKFFQKRQKFTQKNTTDLLQESEIVLYN